MATTTTLYIKLISLQLELGPEGERVRARASRVEKRSDGGQLPPASGSHAWWWRWYGCVKSEQMLEATVGGAAVAALACILFAVRNPTNSLARRVG